MELGPFTTASRAPGGSPGPVTGGWKAEPPGRSMGPRGPGYRPSPRPAPGSGGKPGRKVGWEGDGRLLLGEGGLGGGGAAVGARGGNVLSGLRLGAEQGVYAEGLPLAQQRLWGLFEELHDLFATSCPVCRPGPY